MMAPEGLLVAAGGGCYLVGAGLAWRKRLVWVGKWVLAGALILATGIAVRWFANGQGPFLTLYEILLSSLCSLGFVFGLACSLDPSARQGARLATLVLGTMLIWMAFTDPGSRPLPATYGNPWLWVHVAMGKVFLGCSLVAAGMGFASIFEQQNSGEALLARAWQWLMVAFLFHSAMLIAGAVWAQDAWGRYWAWDPLESWAFVTWLLMAFAFHAKATFRLSHVIETAMIIGVFVLAFLTFFGVPFVSIAPHKGAV